MYGAINKMRDPSFIRVESDEVTYPMHILLRYEIEKGLLLGDIEVDDVPKVWNEKMEAYLGCTPTDDAQVPLLHASSCPLQPPPAPPHSTYTRRAVGPGRRGTLSIYNLVPQGGEVVSVMPSHTPTAALRSCSYCDFGSSK